MAGPLDAQFDVEKELLLATLQVAKDATSDHVEACLLGQNLDVVASPWYVKMTLVKGGKIIGSEDVTDYGAFTTAMTAASLRREMVDAYKTGRKKIVVEERKGSEKLESGQTLFNKMLHLGE